MGGRVDINSLIQAYNVFLWEQFTEANGSEIGNKFRRTPLYYITVKIYNSEHWASPINHRILYVSRTFKKEFKKLR